MNLDDIYTEVIAEHSNSKANKRELSSPDMVLEGVNPSCGDELKIAFKTSEGKIDDLAFTGIGCAISQASASIMSELLRGRTLEEAKHLIALFLKMIKREVTEESALEELGEAVALKNISNMPARVKCAVLAWHTLEEGINKLEE